MTEKQDNPRFTLGPIATDLVREVAQGTTPTRQHLDEGIAALQAKATTTPSGHAPTADIRKLEATVTSLVTAIEVLASDIMHLRYMIVALNAPDEELMVREIDRANDAFVDRTQAQLTALGIPEEKRLNAIDILRERVEMDRGYEDPELEDER
jgi:hypothetical protein